MRLTSVIFKIFDSVQHVPSGFPLSAFIPLLAFLFHHIEPLTTPTSTNIVTLKQQSADIQERDLVTEDMTPALKKLVTEVLMVMEKANRY